VNGRLAVLERLAPVRDKLLDDAAVGPGVVVLDVGCGDGLIGLGAVERGADVIFSDVSEACLDDCRAIVGDGARYHLASATELGAVEADVVTLRSVLIYVEEKDRAFEELHRVLRPGGRLSLFEPINRFGADERRATWGFADVAGIEELLPRLWSREHAAGVNDAMVDFDERDLFAHAERAGFTEVRLELHAELKPQAQWGERDWESFVSSSPNPLLPTLRETMEENLTPEERARVEAKLRPQVERGEGITRAAQCFLLARKA
jgi:SAM-dependent methyltransferase